MKKIKLTFEQITALQSSKGGFNGIVQKFLGIRLNTKGWKRKSVGFICEEKEYLSVQVNKATLKEEFKIKYLKQDGMKSQ